MTKTDSKTQYVRLARGFRILLSLALALLAVIHLQEKHRPGRLRLIDDSATCSHGNTDTGATTLTCA